MLQAVIGIVTQHVESLARRYVPVPDHTAVMNIRDFNVKITNKGEPLLFDLLKDPWLDESTPRNHHLRHTCPN